MKLRNFIWLPLLLAAIMLPVFGCSATQRAEKPADTSWMFHTIVDTAFVQPYATMPQPKGVMIIPDEFANGHLKNASNIPVDKLEKQVKQLPSDKPIVFVCSTGARSGESYYMLQDLRPELKKVYYLEAGLEVNKDGSYKIKPTE